MDSALKNLIKVSVLMPVFNGAKYLRESIESILSQDFSDYEFIIINDGSTDESVEIIKSYNDARIKLISNEKNLGLISTLNKGIQLCKGEYIVRMDCDDISFKDRIKFQVAFMDKYKNIGASGSFYKLLRNNKSLDFNFPVHYNETKAFLFFNSPIAHPASIIRRSVLIDNNIFYKSDFKHAEDFRLWLDISKHSDLANIKKILLLYRVHENQITGNLNLSFDKNKSLNIIRTEQLEKLSIYPSVEQMILHTTICEGTKFKTFSQLVLADEWLLQLTLKNKEKLIFNHLYFQKIILERWLRACINFLGIKKGISFFIKSKTYKMINLPFKLKLELLISFYNSWKRKN